MINFSRLVLCALMLSFLSTSVMAQEPLDLADLVAQVERSVVNIAVISGPPAEGKSIEPKSIASGFFIRSDGFLVTTESLLEKNEASYIVTVGKTKLSARLVGKDKATHIAVLKVESEGWQAVKPADMSKVRTGQRVLMVGSALGGMNTAADGIVSHFGRPFPIQDALPLMSLSVPTYPGDGGAPIFNMRGEVLGMVSVVLGPKKDSPYSALTFATPMDVVLSAASSIIEHGRVVRGVIHIGTQEVTEELARLFGLNGKPRGALVTNVGTDGPADRAGVKLGDIILEFDRKPVAHALEIREFVAAETPGRKVPVIIFRNGKPIELSIEIEELENDQ